MDCDTGSSNWFANITLVKRKGETRRKEFGMRILKRVLIGTTIITAVFASTLSVYTHPAFFIMSAGIIALTYHTITFLKRGKRNHA